MKKLLIMILMALIGIFVIGGLILTLPENSLGVQNIFVVFILSMALVLAYIFSKLFSLF